MHKIFALVLLFQTISCRHQAPAPTQGEVKITTSSKAIHHPAMSQPAARDYKLSKKLSVVAADISQALAGVKYNNPLKSAELSRDIGKVITILSASAPIKATYSTLQIFYLSGFEVARRAHPVLGPTAIIEDYLGGAKDMGLIEDLFYLGLEWDISDVLDSLKFGLLQKFAAGEISTILEPYYKAESESIAIDIINRYRATGIKGADLKALFATKFSATLTPLAALFAALSEVERTAMTNCGFSPNMEKPFSSGDITKWTACIFDCLGTAEENDDQEGVARLKAFRKEIRSKEEPSLNEP